MAIDLYGARCGTVHTFGSASTLSAGKDARQIVYSWHPSEKSLLQQLISIGQMESKYVEVHGDDLVHAVRNGIEAFMRDLASDPENLSRANSSASNSFRYMSDEEALELLNWGKELSRDLKTK
jgi:hypothetical protein